MVNVLNKMWSSLLILPHQNHYNFGEILDTTFYIFPVENLFSI